MALSVSQKWIAQYSEGANTESQALQIAKDKLGNVYTTGYTRNLSTNNYDYITIKYDTNGNQLWVSRYDGGVYDVPQSLAVDDNGNVYVTGGSKDSSQSSVQSIATVKYDNAGNQLWAVRYSGVGYRDSVANAIKIDSAGNPYITGYTSFDGSKTSIITIKYDANGNQLWANSHSFGIDDRGVTLNVDNLGNVYVLGSSWNSSNLDGVTIKYDTNGNQLWVSRYDLGGNQSLTDMTVDSSGSIYETGYSDAAGTQDYAIVNTIPTAIKHGAKFMIMVAAM